MVWCKLRYFTNRPLLKAMESTHIGLMVHLAQVLSPLRDHESRDQESRDQDQRIKITEKSMRAGQTSRGIAPNSNPQSHFVALRLPAVLFLHFTVLQEFLSHGLAEHCFQSL